MMDVVVDGLVAAREQLPGKPAPIPTSRPAARSERRRTGGGLRGRAGGGGGRAGHFGWVVGVDRGGEAAAVRAEGADVVVTNLADLLDSP